jgi:4-diphosphocytidyl-2-C-methyl-D-erythritol kinase
MDELHHLAAKLGSDCPFFLYGESMMMESRGELLSPFRPGLEETHFVVIFTGIHISTAWAYREVEPARREKHLRERLRLPSTDWIRVVKNDFEQPVFKAYPGLKRIKEDLYRAGALYASLSGSGSALFGIFSKVPDLPAGLAEHMVWTGMAGVPSLNP